MYRFCIRQTFFALLFGCVIFTVDSSFAQKPVSRGFSTKVDAIATGKERANQTELWVLEVHYKPMRLIRIELTDPKTGKKKSELVWYLVYKAINRPFEQQDVASQNRPINDLDAPPYKRPIFVPEFTLISDDNGVQRIYPDQIIPQAQAAIVRRERQALKNSVQIVGEIPPETPLGTRQEQAIYGVAMWRGIDPKTDYFTVFMNGFSNAYIVGQDEAGKPLILRKTIMQKYWRPGDRFGEEETEFRHQEEPKWIYRADAPIDAANKAPKADSPPVSSKPDDEKKPATKQ